MQRGDWRVCVRTHLLWVALILLCWNPVFAQFKVAPKPNPFAFDQKKKRKILLPIRYNRVEGFFAAAGVELRSSEDSPFMFSVDGGYGFQSEKVGYNLKAEYEWPGWELFSLGGHWFEDTFTKDDWVIPRYENSLAAFFLRSDFRDFYRARGLSAWASKDFEEWLHFRLAFDTAEYDSIAKNTDWSVFGGDRKFRSNPAIIPGRENRLRLEVIIDKLDNPMFPMSGWMLEGAYEKAGDFLGGDFEQSGLYLNARYLRPTLANQRFVLSGRYGRSTSQARQHLMDLGGITTLKGYCFKEFRNGDRLAMGSLQYYFNGDLLQKIPLQSIPTYSSLGLILFTEVGALWNTEGFGSRIGDSPDWKWDVGFSLAVTGDFIRVDFARRLDRSDGDWLVTFRLLPKI